MQNQKTPNFRARLEICDHLEGEACREVSMCPSQMFITTPGTADPKGSQGSASLTSSLAMAAVAWFELERVRLGLESIWHISSLPRIPEWAGLEG